MIEKHIINIGLPKCGTSWLWHWLEKHPATNRHFPNVKENNIIFNHGWQGHYKDYYKDYKISANFHACQWHLDRELINFLNSCSTHATFIVSNPYTFINRWYNWLKLKGLYVASGHEFVDFCIACKCINYFDIYQRWESIFGDKFKVFFFEDIQNNPTQFLDEYFRFCGLGCFDVSGCDTKVNENILDEKVQVVFSNPQKLSINNQIKKFQSITNRDLSTWIQTTS